MLSVGVGSDDSIDISWEQLNRVLGYKDTFWPQGFWRVSDDRPINSVLATFDI